MQGTIWTTAGKEDTAMRKVMKDAMEDCSTPEEFRFQLHCAECGRTWNSRSLSFSKAGRAPKTEGKRIIFQTLYKREWEAAREKAAAKASQGFNLCPVCGRLVCDRCFLICEDLDMCVSCA